MPGGLSPLIFAVVDVPLVGERDHAHVPAAAHDLALRFAVHYGLPGCNHFFFDDLLHLAHLVHPMQPATQMRPK